ncbi:hypothetical protein SUGI_0649420 [Cryptomeria japonica]|nr:hypothetical protein SUGI_0649420 [Cryptomeria japonica]
MCLCDIEKFNSQLKRLFVVEEDSLLQTIKNILGDRLLQERYKEGVRAPIQPVKPNPKEGFIADVFDAEAVGKKQRVVEDTTMPFANFFWDSWRFVQCLLD